MINTFASHPLQYWRVNIPEFMETCLVNAETGELFKLLPAERLFISYAFQLDDNGRLKHRDWVYATPKKGGKSGFGALLQLTVILLFGGRFAEGFCVANDLEQATSRVFQMCQRIVEATPWLKAEANITQKAITFPATGSTIIPLASDYGSAAGAHPVISVVDEPWAVTRESGYRLWDELIPVPTRPFSVRLAVTHAGFEGESTLLYDIYKRGLQQPQVAEDLYSGDGLLMFWTNKPVAPWQDEAWFSDCRRTMRPNQFLRMCENRWVTNEDNFVDMAAWDACTNPNLERYINDPSLPVFAAVDASTKHDQTALVAVNINQAAQQVRLVTHRVYQPSPDDPLDFEETIERTLLEWRERFCLVKVLCDPWQMQATMQRLRNQGLPIEEFPQSPANLTAASQNLYELITAQNLVVYPDEQLRLAISRAIAKETPRGWKISKDKQSHKIDLVVALAMAAYAAVQGKAEDYYDLSGRWISNEQEQQQPDSRSWRAQQLYSGVKQHHADAQLRAAKVLAMTPMSKQAKEQLTTIGVGIILVVVGCTSWVMATALADFIFIGGGGL